ncbi:MAG TPA: DEAD/DEAH box helicase family protein, partial [Anaerovoracaceae bacterium]|nr:DEAD/DEAH box helicase family protein [Anaerovoracaceae bacterium]
MKKLNIDLNAAESRVMDGLKDFQRATVNRIVEVFESGQNRVLVADEVGLGKTLIARGVIAKTALMHHHDRDRLFKVVYVCSNQSIADQNLNKLRISQEVTQQSVSTSRLSMQHLNIFMQEHDEAILGGYIQLIPLTPETSFRMTSGTGSVDERALMYAILRRIPEFQSHLRQLRVLMIDWAPTAWENWAEAYYEKKVIDCDFKSKGRYLQYMLKEVPAILKRERVIPLLEKQLELIRKNANHRVPSNELLGKLRLVFSRISLKRLEPDLVIMDEFQRFKFLISADETTDTGLLARKFLSSNKVKTLLLSATPYKLYSTLEEIDENQVDEHYSEFFGVMDFLYNNKERSAEFKNVWNDYSVKLRELDLGDTTILEAKKNSEQALYGAVCRTERITAEKSGDFIDDSSVKRKRQVMESDIRSYIQAQTLLESAFPGQSFPLDYIKSCSYVMSFMKDYQVKKRLESYYKNHPDEIKAANKDLLWIKKATLNAYKPLEAGHLRLNLLKESAFCNKSERLLWVPPSKPYYEPRGVFKEAGDFSKILVFSSWEMVPRMISSLLSYEAECRSVGRLTAKANKEDLKNANYFAKRRYPGPRLRFSVSDGSPKAMNLFTLLYPSEYLAACFDPIQFMNEVSENGSARLKDLEKSIRLNISEKLDLIKLPRVESGQEDDRWYYLAPLLLDKKDYVLNWFSNSRNKGEVYEDENDEDRGQKGYFAHLDLLLEQFSEDEFYTFGKQPADLLDVLTTMALASPAVCAYRMLKHYKSSGLAADQNIMPDNPEAIWATHIAKMIVDRFNSAEATSIVELCYEKSREAHWQNVLSYCRDGNLQSVFDEFAHMLIESNGLIHSGRKSYHLQ